MGMTCANHIRRNSQFGKSRTTVNGAITKLTQKFKNVSKVNLEKGFKKGKVKELAKEDGAESKQEKKEGEKNEKEEAQRTAKGKGMEMDEEGGTETRTGTTKKKYPRWEQEQQPKMIGKATKTQHQKPR
ncbi:MAG: hypothetical protein Q9205_004634 [Flavoplaca limonia]